MIFINIEVTFHNFGSRVHWSLMLKELYRLKIYVFFINDTVTELDITIDVHT